MEEGRASAVEEVLATFRAGTSASEALLKDDLLAGVAGETSLEGSSVDIVDIVDSVEQLLQRCTCRRA